MGRRGLAEAGVPGHGAAGSQDAEGKEQGSAVGMELGFAAQQGGRHWCGGGALGGGGGGVRLGGAYPQDIVAGSTCGPHRR